MKIGKIPVKYFFSPKRWWSYIRGKWYKKIVTEHYMKQFVYRYTNPTCKPCIESGKCQFCGCDTVAKMMVPEEVCIHGETGEVVWGPMVSEKAFKEIEELYGIDYSHKRTKEVDGSTES